MRKLYGSFLGFALLAISNFAQTNTFTDVNNVLYEVLSTGDFTAQVIKNNSNNPTGEIEILSSVTIDGNNYTVTTIGRMAFDEHMTLTDVTIPNTVTTIEEFAFNQAMALESVTIPNSVTSIGANAFNMCSNLTSVTIPNSVINIGDGAFWSSGLTSVTIPNRLTSIGESTFQACPNLTSVTIPNSVTSIGDFAFIGSGLTSVTIPESVTSIGFNAFFLCSSLATVTSLSETPADISGLTNVFSSIDTNAVLRIPTDTTTEYNDNGWSSYFATVTEDASLSNEKYTISGLKLFTTNGSVKANLNQVSIEVYTVNGKKVENKNLKRGLYIVVAKNNKGQIHTQKLLF